MSLTRTLLFGVLLVAPVTSAQQTIQASKNDADRKYQELAARLQAGDLSIDFRALRFACSAAQDCEVRGNVTELAARDKAEQQGDLKTAIQIDEKLLERGYADMETHADLVGLYKMLGDQKQSQFHMAIVYGLMRSIRAGDGATKDTAFEVISTREVWMTMVSMGLPYMASDAASRRFTDNGHGYVVMSARDPKTDQMKEVFFNYDHVNLAKDVPNRP